VKPKLKGQSYEEVMATCGKSQLVENQPITTLWQTNQSQRCGKPTNHNHNLWQSNQSHTNHNLWQVHLYRATNANVVHIDFSLVQILGLVQSLSHLFHLFDVFIDF